MRQIILGSIKNNPIITHNIESFYPSSRVFIQFKYRLGNRLSFFRTDRS